MGYRSKADMEADRERFRAAIEVLRLSPPILLDTTLEDLLLVVCQLQLALSHPANKGRGASKVRQWADQVSAVLYAIAPELETVLEKGWDRAFDQTERL